MFSEMFYKLWNNGLIQLGIWETVYMTLISSAFAYLIGLPLGVILNVTDKKGIAPHPKLNSVLGFVVNFFRSIPFIILMGRDASGSQNSLSGTMIGNKAVIVMLIVAAGAVRRAHGGKLSQRGERRRYRSGAVNGREQPLNDNRKVLVPEAKPRL